MMYKYNDIVAVNDIHNETVGIGLIVDYPLLEGTDEKYMVKFNSGNPITINRRSIKRCYYLKNRMYDGFVYRMRNIIRHLDRGTYMTEQEFEDRLNDFRKTRGYPSSTNNPYFFDYIYELRTSGELNRKEVERIEASPIKIDIDDEIKEENKKMVNNTFGVYTKHYWEPGLTYKKIIFNGPCTIILWADGTKTIAKLYEDIDKFDPEKGVAICFMKKVFGHTETNKILRKATKQYADETTKSSNTSPTIQETLKTIAEKLSEPLISFNKEDN